MTFSAGTRLGPYEIRSALGAGGMGEVYRARDERLERTVAIKVLAPEWCRDDDSRERFRREARALSKLSHPNVCAVYDVGIEAGRDYFVMELLEGETLAARLERGRVAVDETIQIARDIAAALAASHRVGLVHRDLKPANVMLTSSGVKLLDFGLVRFAATPSQVTVTNALTTYGTLLGTYEYMSPEQVNGQEVDSRSDIFSFGVVLYEMLSGRRAFAGETLASLAASILRDRPASILSLQPATPRELASLIDSCLAKNRDDRWQSAHDLYLELGWWAEKLRQPVDARPVALQGSSWSWIAGAAIGISLLVIAMLVGRKAPQAPEQPPVRAVIPPPQDSQFISVGLNAGPAVISPDGRRVAFVASSVDGRRRLWTRSLGSVVTQALAGTDGASYPFWSRDGEQLGFFADRKLKTVALVTGAVISLCDAPYAVGGTWNREGTIVFAPGLGGALQRIPATGGSPRPATTLNSDRAESTHRWPVFLPDEHRFLYSVGQKAKPGDWHIRVGSLDSDRTEDVLDGASNALYANGALIFARRGTLLAQPMEERSLRATGDPVPLADGILYDADLGRAVFSASQNGTLVYQLGGASAAAAARMVWFDRTGKELGAIGDTCFCIWPRLSPDGKRTAVAITDANTGNTDIWIYESDGRHMHLTFEQAVETHPAWTPDGSRVIFTSTRTGTRDIHWKDALGRSEQEPLFKSNVDKYVQSASKHGVVYDQDGDLWLLPLTGERHFEPRRLLATKDVEQFGEVSPNGQWLLYQSNEVGKNNVYVTSFPALTGKWLVSEDGGILPKWSADGREIFYLSQDHATIFASAVSAQGSAFRVTGVQRLFSVSMVAGRGYPYDVAPDGRRFLVVTSSGATATPLILVLNWPSEVKH